MWPFSTLVRDSFIQSEVESRDGASGHLSLEELLAATATPTYSGVPVSSDTAVNLPAVYRAISLNAETIASLPLDVYQKTGSARVPHGDPVWLRNPNKLQSLPEFVAATQVSLDIDGNAYWRKISSDRGQLGGIEVLPPASVEPEIISIEGVDRLVFWVDDGTKREPVASSAVVHLRSMGLPGSLKGLSPIACARQTIGVGLAAERYGAQFFGNGATMSGLISHPGTPTAEQVENLKKQFMRRHGGIANSHAVGVLHGGATWTPLSVKPEEAQFLQSRKYTAVEIANLFGVPPELVSDSDGAKGYVTALHARLRMWYLTGLMPRINRIEAALTSLMPPNVYAKFNVNALMKMDPAERTSFYQAAQQGEWMTRNEIRALEDMNPVDGGDEFLHSVQWQESAPPDDDGTDEPTEPAPAGSPVKEPEE